MTPLFKKLNLGATVVIHVLDAPPEFEAELAQLEGVKINRKVTGKVTFALAFVTTLAGVNAATKSLTGAAEGDAALWMVYPKGTSKRYRCEFNRDSGWQALGDAGYEPVRQIAIDADWSALRFRKAEFIRSMTRNPAGAISKHGRSKARESQKGHRKSRAPLMESSVRSASSGNPPPRR